jgi:hypothetical protein
MSARLLIRVVLITLCSLFTFDQPSAQDNRRALDDWQNQAGAYRDPCQLRPELAPCKGSAGPYSPERVGPIRPPDANVSPGAPRSWERIPPPR